MYFLVELNPLVTPSQLVALPLLSPLTCKFTLDSGLPSSLVSLCNCNVLSFTYFIFCAPHPTPHNYSQWRQQSKYFQHSNHVKKLSSLVLGTCLKNGRRPVTLGVEDGDVVSNLCRLMLYTSVLILSLSADQQVWE